MRIQRKTRGVLAPVVSCGGVDSGWLSAVAEGVALRLRISPGARKTALRGVYEGGPGGGALRLAVAAPPVDGRANAEVERLAATFGVARSAVAVRRGSGGRSKRVVVSGVSLEEARRALGAERL